MTASATPRPPTGLPLRAAGLVAAAVLVGIPVAFAVDAGRTPAGITIPPVAGYSTVSETGPRWSSLTAAQREALRPLEEDWPQIDASRKQKWLEIAARYPALAPAERQRLQQRMTDWARLSPTQRGEVRLNFQQAARTAPAAERQAQWQAYQALPAEEKSRLATRAAEGSKAPVKPSAAAARADDARPTDVNRATTAASKSNLVPNPLFTTAPRPVGPTLVRPATGATTTLVNRQPAPPVHQQPGLPKVVATPAMVDPNTLLPQRGPQAAAVVTPAPAPTAAAPAAATPAEAPAASAPAAAPASAPASSGPPYTDTSIGER